MTSQSSLFSFMIRWEVAMSHLPHPVLLPLPLRPQVIYQQVLLSKKQVKRLSQNSVMQFINESEGMQKKRDCLQRSPSNQSRSPASPPPLPLQLPRLSLLPLTIPRSKTALLIQHILCDFLHTLPLPSQRSWTASRSHRWQDCHQRILPHY